MNTVIVVAIGRRNGGGYKTGELYVFYTEDEAVAAAEAVNKWCKLHALTYVTHEVLS